MKSKVVAWILMLAIVASVFVISFVGNNDKTSNDVDTVVENQSVEINSFNIVRK